MTIGTKSLQLGDILITAVDNTVSHCGIVGGTTTVNTPAGKVDRADMIYHATSKGIKCDDATGWANRQGGVGVFRMRGLRHLSVGGKPAAKQDQLPPARYAVSFQEGGEVIVYGEQCLGPKLCFSWQRWPALQPASQDSK